MFRYMRKYRVAVWKFRSVYKPFTKVLVSAKEQPQKVFIEKYSTSNIYVDTYQ